MKRLPCNEQTWPLPSTENLNRNALPGMGIKKNQNNLWNDNLIIVSMFQNPRKKNLIVLFYMF